MLAGRGPAAVGVNETIAMQYEPAGSGSPFKGQSVLRAKSLGPVNAIELTASGPVPVLDSMKAAAPLAVEPTFTLPKLVPRPNTLSVALGVPGGAWIPLPNSHVSPSIVAGAVAAFHPPDTTI